MSTGAVHNLTLIVGSVKAPAETKSPFLRALIVVSCLLSAVCITMQGRQAGLGGGLDAVAAAKLVTRLLAFAVLSFVILRTHTQPRAAKVLLRSTPLVLFSLWTLASCLWSPIKGVSIGHAAETLMLAMLAIGVGIVFKSEDDVKDLLLGIVVVITILMSAMVAANWDLIRSGERPVYYIQPNNLAGIAACGLLTLLMSRFFWDWTWTRKLMWPTGLICGFVLLVARSRSCLIVTALIAIPLLWSMQKRRVVVLAIAAAGVIAALLPYSTTVSNMPQAVTTYVMRGQTSQDMYTVSGRTEVWDIAVKSFFGAPLFGHGYYSMTDTGTMYVWGAERWQTAHNTYLHVLTGTGLIGFFLMAWALLHMLHPIIAYARQEGPRRKMAIFVLLLAVWYLALGCFELSFAGPVDPEVVLFFCTLGIAAGLVAHANTHPA
jgi:O-antigen ligase